MMNKVFHFDSPRGHYHCDAAVVWCFDHRFHQGFAKFLKRNGMAQTDVIKIAGGAKSLASPDSESERAVVLDQIRKSARLHGTPLVILMVHSDCGAYGGLAAFKGDARAEARHHEEELRKAAVCLHAAIPGLEIRCYFADFEGIWEAEISGAAAAV